MAPGGSGVQAFNTAPTIVQGWSTLGVGTGSGGFTATNQIDASVQTLAAGSINQPLPVTGVTPPGAATLARWNSTLQRVQTRASGNDYTALLATLRNDVGNPVGGIRISYAYGIDASFTPAEDVPGHRVYYSDSGSPGSWKLIPEFSGVTTSGVLTAHIKLTWPTNAPLFLLWADDNATGTEGAYTLDDFSVLAFVDTNIVITSQPQPVVVPQGSPALFEISAAGAQPLRYQWFKENAPVSGATNATFTIEAVTAGDVGTYSVVVSNAYANVVSSNAPLTIGTNPVAVTSHPTNLLVNAGNAAMFRAEVSGTLPRLQWFRNGELLSDATNRTLLLPAASAADAGVYWFRASNLLNAVTSSNVFLHVRPAPMTLVQLTNDWRYNSSGADLGTSWKDSAFDDSSWSNGPAALGFDTSAAVAPLIKTPLSLTNDSGGRITTYYFRTSFTVTNTLSGSLLLASNLLDDGAVYYLNGVELHRQTMPLGAITADTLATSDAGGYPEGTFYTFTVPASSIVTGENVLAVEVHQLSLGSSDIAFATALHLLMPDAGPVVVRTNPASQLAVEGSTVTFSAAVAGSMPLSLQWFYDGVPVLGATNQTLILTNVGQGSAGSYHLVVSNHLNVAVSGAAHLNVLSAEGLPTMLVDFSASWKFQSGRADLGTSWRQTDFSDETWPTGNGVFASSFILPPEPVNTVLPLQTPQGESITTYYFRKRFLMPGTNSAAVLLFTNLLDDGAVFYLNGVELHRVRIASGPVSYGTFASSAPGNGTRFESLIVPTTALQPGTNVLAVEVHQSSASSFDVVFGIQLNVVPGPGEAPSILSNPADVTVPVGYPAAFAGEVFGSAPLHFQWLKDGAPLRDATNASLFLPATTFDDAGSYVLRASNSLNVAFSSAAVLTIAPETNPPVALLRGPYLQNGTTNSVVVRWRSSELAQSRVFFGTNENDLNSMAVDSALKKEHELTLPNLLPDTRYFYSVWTGFSNLAGGSGFTFRTVPANTRPIRIWAQGDSGMATPAARAVVNAFTNFNLGQSADVWLMLGDNAYNTGTDEEYQVAVFDFMPDVLRQTLLWPTIGNHETYSTSVPGPFPYLDIFTLPTQGEGGGVPSGTKRYYSFDYGNIHFVCLDSESSSRSATGAMATWLEQDLAANAKDWLIAYWHSPPYTKGSHNSDNPADTGGTLVEMRENILPILESYGVDLVLGGHSHCYERSFLLDGHYGYSHTLQPLMLKDSGSGRESDTGAYRKAGTGPAPREGTVYVVAGSSGHATFGSLDHPVMRVSLLEMGSLVIDVNSNRLDGFFLRETGAVDDHFTIVKGASPEDLRVAAFHLEGNVVRGAWKSVAGRSYQVEASAAVSGAPWVPVGNVLQASGATSFWTNSVTAGDTLFYRVRDVSP